MLIFDVGVILSLYSPFPLVGSAGSAEGWTGRWFWAIGYGVWGIGSGQLAMGYWLWAIGIPNASLGYPMLILR